ncbi:MAG: TGS domain-containing protein [Desulfurococcaceae archaeon]|nr:TGS domain-containing protein [Desulfurococcaceae archaeon]
MPTNLPAEAKAKWIKVMEARSVEEKIRALEEFLSAVPKHKGTERLREWATKRLAQLREELEEEKRRKRSTGKPSFFLEKEGAAQVVVIGPTNSGKSTLVHALTGAKTEISDYPYATQHPVPGMMKYQDIYFQLVDTPPLEPDTLLARRTVALTRNADGVLLVLDATRSIREDLNRVIGYLRSEGMLLVKPKGRVIIDIVRTGKSGIRVTLMGKLLDSTIDDLRRLLESYRIYNAHVKLYGEVTLDDVEQSIFEAVVYKPVVVFINKTDLREPTSEEVEYVEKSLPGAPIILGSATTRRGLSEIASSLYRVLEIIRVYTKPPGGSVAEKPLVLRRGATIRDVAESVHSDLVKNFLYARVWGPSAKYPGERVGLEHVVEDGDVVEIHSRG